MSRDFGRFVWFELVAADTPKAEAFYTELAGWKVEPMDMPGDTKYPVLKVKDASVGGIAAPSAAGTPVHWLSYVSVEDVEATAKRVKKHGGSIVADAFEIPTVGLMQPVKDPQGAPFVLFRSAYGDPPAAEGPGSFHWNELWAAEPEAAVDFYEKVLGYTHEALEMPMGTYFVLKTGDAARGGIMKNPAAKTPAFWQQFITVDDCDAAVGRAEAGGGKRLSDVQEVPGVGRFATIADPLGATIGVIKPAPQP